MGGGTIDDRYDGTIDIKLVSATRRMNGPSVNAELLIVGLTTLEHESCADNPSRSES